MNKSKVPRFLDHLVCRLLFSFNWETFWTQSCF